VSALSAEPQRAEARDQDAGMPIGDMDVLMASVCLVAGHSVLTLIFTGA
jgi:hypothetical protein